jgi:hypothetical protein
LTAFRLSPVFSETNFANFQICLGLGKCFVENMARILRGVEGIFGLCTGGVGVLLCPFLHPACLPSSCLPSFLPSFIHSLSLSQHFANPLCYRLPGFSVSRPASSEDRLATLDPTIPLRDST